MLFHFKNLFQDLKNYHSWKGGARFNNNSGRQGTNIYLMLPMCQVCISHFVWVALLNKMRSLTCMFCICTILPHTYLKHWLERALYSVLSKTVCFRYTSLQNCKLASAVFLSLTEPGMDWVLCEPHINAWWMNGSLWKWGWQWQRTSSFCLSAPWPFWSQLGCVCKDKHAGEDLSQVFPRHILLALILGATMEKLSYSCEKSQTLKPGRELNVNKIWTLPFNTSVASIV